MIGARLLQTMNRTFTWSHSELLSLRSSSLQSASFHSSSDSSIPYPYSFFSKTMIPPHLSLTSRNRAAVILRRRQLEDEEIQKQERLEWKQKLAQRSQKLQQDPAYRWKMELLAQQKLEDAPEVAFRQLFDYKLIPIFGPWSLPFIRVHKRFWEWEKGAKEQLKELRESERIELARRCNGGSLYPGE